MNKWVITGKVTKEPEIKEIKVKNETRKLAKFSVAVQKKFDNSSAEFIDVAIWGNRADYVEKHIHKADGVMLVGTPTASAYQTKDNDIKAQLSITVDEIEKISFGGKEKEETESPKEPVEEPAKAETPLTPIKADDLPF